MTSTDQDRDTISRILTNLGLTSGVDFRAKVYMAPDGETATGVIVGVYGAVAPKLVAHHADVIEVAARARGTRFRVSVRYPFELQRDTPLVSIADFGTRVREVKPPAGRARRHSF